MSTQNDSQPQPNVEGGADAETQFSIQRVYVKDVSFEAPNSPDVFRAEWKPDVQLHVNSSAPALGANVYDVTLTVTVTAKLGERTAFLVEVQQAGIFNIAGLSEADLGMMLGAFCPNILFPYAREAVTNLVARGGFPQLVLAPVNFDALYLQQLEQKQAAASVEAEPKN